MSTCRVDDSGAGKYSQQFSAGARRFCETHSGENWHIVGAEAANGITLSVSFNDTAIGDGWPLILSPTHTLDDDVFRVLDDLRRTVIVTGTF